jgi:hypothetical protein
VAAEVIMARKELLKNVFSKGKELADDLVDEFGEYLETGKEYFENLGGSKNPDNVTQQTITNKQNKQAEIETVKKKRKPKSQEFVKTLNYEYILNSSDPLKKQQALDVLENLRKGRLKKFEAEKELKRLFPEKTGMVGDVNYAFTKLKDTYEDTRRRSPKFEEDIFDINIPASKGGKKPTAVTKDIADRLIKIADADTSSEPFSVKFANAFIKELKPNLGKGKISDTSYPTYKNTANAILKFRNRDDIVDMPTQGKGKVFINDDGTRTVVQGARGGDKSAKELFMEIPEGELVKGYPAQYMKQNVVDASGQTYTKAFNSVTKQNPYVADKLADMRQFFDEDLGQYHFYGLDHIQPLRFGGTNANTNLRFTMEGPHSAVDTLTPNKTLSDIDVKNKSKMEAEIHGLGTDIVDILYEASRANNPATKAKLQEQAITLSQQIKNMTNAFSKTYNKVDFHIGEPYVAVKTGDTAKFIKYSDYVGANNETRNLISQLIPDQFNKPNAGKSIEQQVDEVYTIYADMFNLGGPIKKEAMQQMTNYKDGGVVDEETGQPLPDISIEFGGEDSGQGAVGGFTPPEPVANTEEDIGIGEYLTDAYTNVSDSVNEFTEGNMYRLLPKLISKGLSSPGDYADSVLSKVDDYNEMIEQEARREGSGAARDEKMNDQTSKFAQAMANPVIAGAKVFDFITMPLQKGYENMFSDDDSIYIPFYGEIPADTNFKKAVAAGATVGLTVLEVAALFSPLAIARLGALSTPKVAEIMARHSGKILTTALIGGYELKDPFIFGEGGIIDGIAGFFQDNEGVGAEAEDDLNREIQKEEQRNVEGNQLEYAEGGMVDPLPPEFTGEYAETKLAMGGEPGQFSNPTPSGLEEEIDVGDYLLEPAYESVQDLDNIFDITRQAEDAFETDGGFLDDQAVEVASRKEGLKYIFGEVPNWVRQGKERIQMGIEKILPKTGDELEQSLITRADEIDEGLTPITKSQPGQLFYSKLEAELMQGPKEYKDVEAFKKYYQSRNIPKIEIIDSELERIIEGATKAGQPISREMVLGALKESPIRYVQSKGYGFLSNVLDGQQRGLKYSGYKEYGAIPNTDRERLLFIDPNDLRGDPGRLPPGISPHDWEEPYTIAWSRLSDRQLGGKFTGKTTTFADEIQSDIFQAAQKTAGKLSAKIKYMAQNNVPLDTINNELQRDMMTFFADKGTVYRESLPGSAQLQKELQALMGLQDQLTALKNTPVPEITDEMLEAAQKVRYQQSDIIDNMTEELNLQLVKQLYPNLPFKLRGQWADASIKRDIYEAAYRKFVLKDPDATDYYAVTPANLVTKRYSHSGSSATSQADRVADKDARIKQWVDGGMEGEVAPSQYPGIGMYEFYGGPGADVVTDTGKHYTSEIEKIMKRIAKENNVNLEVLPVRVGDQQVEVFNVVNRETGEILGTGNTGRQADAIANDIIDNSDIKVIVERANQFDTADSFGIELTPEMAEAFKAYMAKGGYVQEEIVRPYGD